MAKNPKQPLEACTVGFYNLENLFDTRNDPTLLDDDFTPGGFKRWTPERYENKLRKLGKAIGQMGRGRPLDLPVLLGMAEVENESVLDDLLSTDTLKGSGLEYVHFDSPDERGIDTALCYHREHFEPEGQEVIPLLVYEPDGQRDFTRDILHVHGWLNGEHVHIFVNHWPSRRDGDSETAHKRMTAAQTVRDRIWEIRSENPEANTIVMGDFNDDPHSESLKHLEESAALHNPMQQLFRPDRGSAKYRDTWMLFDQILLSHTFLNYQPGTHRFSHADIFDPEFLQEWNEPYKGKPFRTYVGRNYLGGYSDHFPVYVHLEREG